MLATMNANPRMKLLRLLLPLQLAAGQLADGMAVPKVAVAEVVAVPKVAGVGVAEAVQG